MVSLMVAILILDTKSSSTAATPVYEPIGCFSNRGISPHPMSLLLKDFRPDMNWNEIDSVVKRCANLAHEKRLRYFGLKYYGECWSGETADQTYNRDGPSEACVRGVGQRSSYFVYKFYDYGDRNIIPVSGSFFQHATDASIIGHVIKRLLVDDAVSCARECLLYLNCLSINYEYKPTANPESIHLGMICELNDDTSTDMHFQPRSGYKYYERLTPNSLTQFNSLFQ